MDESERLARVRQLLAGLPGPYGNEHLWVLTGFADGDNVFVNVFAFLQDCGVIDTVSRFGDPPQSPQDAVELAPLVREVDRDAAIAVLVGMTSQTLAYHVGGRYSITKAQDVFNQLTLLLGHGTRWWTNTTLTSWTPITRHTFDALVVGAGSGLVVAVLAVDED